MNVGGRCDIPLVKEFDELDILAADRANVPISNSNRFTYDVGMKATKLFGLHPVVKTIPATE